LTGLYFILGDIHQYWLVLLSGDTFICCDAKYGTIRQQLAPSTG